jgi:hypothetical protein
MSRSNRSTPQNHSIALAANALGVWVTLHDIAHRPATLASYHTDDADRAFSQVLEDAPRPAADTKPFRSVRSLSPYKPTAVEAQEAGIWFEAFANSSMSDLLRAQSPSLAAQGKGVLSAITAGDKPDESGRRAASSRYINVTTALDNFFETEVQPYALAALTFNDIGPNRVRRFTNTLLRPTSLAPIVRPGKRTIPDLVVPDIESSAVITRLVAFQGLRGDTSRHAIVSEHDNVESGLSAAKSRVDSVFSRVELDSLKASIETGQDFELAPARSLDI